MTDEFQRIAALESVLEWMLWRLVSTSPKPKEVLDNFDKHMKERGTMLNELSMKQLLAGNTEAYTNLSDGSFALEEVRETLMKTINVAG